MSDSSNESPKDTPKKIKEDTTSVVIPRSPPKKGKKRDTTSVVIPQSPTKKGEKRRQQEPPEEVQEIPPQKNF